MPELPEVETMVRGIRPFVEGRKLLEVRRCRCPCKPISIEPRMPAIVRRAKGEIVTSVRRVAKRVVLELATGDAFVIEPRMTGMMVLSDPPDRGHLRVEWKFAGQMEFNSLWFWDRRGLGTIRFYSAEELQEQLGPRKLGPDALVIREQDWRERFSRTGRDIKVAMLDQKLVAGIGNLYASEILHLAKIHPVHPANKLKPAQLRRLHNATRKVLKKAIRYEGSTLNDGTYRNALNKSGRYQNSHAVYSRADEVCPTCQKGVIQRIVQTQRSTFFCPVCQK